MTEQLKAEAYVRSQRPALYKQENSICSAHMVALNKDCDNCQTGWLSPNLQDWLAVLIAKCDIHYWHKNTIVVVKKGFDITGKNQFPAIEFFLDTGQPLLEADYKAFNKITSV
jgi:hypothetical protein